MKDSALTKEEVMYVFHPHPLIHLRHYVISLLLIATGIFF
jgi:hypothetical protein